MTDIRHLTIMGDVTEPQSANAVRKRLPDQVAHVIKSRILAGFYLPGHCLPPQQILAQEFGVTRLTVREALQRTEAAGFTKSKQGEGTLVCDVRHQANLQFLSEILSAGHELSEQEITSLLEFRSVVSLGFVPAIVQNATSAHMEKLRAIILRERAVLDNLDAMVDLDCEFHELLAAASGNRVYALLVQSVRPAYLHLCRIVFGAIEQRAPIADAHELILRGLEARDCAALAQAIGSFVACGNSIIEQALRCKVVIPTSCQSSTPLEARRNEPK